MTEPMHPASKLNLTTDAEPATEEQVMEAPHPVPEEEEETPDEEQEPE